MLNEERDLVKHFVQEPQHWFRGSIVVSVAATAWKSIPFSLTFPSPIRSDPARNSSVSFRDNHTVPSTRRCSRTWLNQKVWTRGLRNAQTDVVALSSPLSFFFFLFSSLLCSQNRSAAYFNTNRKRIADINVRSLNEITIIKGLR